MAITSEQVAASPLVGGGVTALHSHAGEGDGTPANVKSASETSADSITNAEVLVISAPSITITGTNRVLIQAFCEAVKDGGNTSRTVGIRVRQGTQVADSLVAECRGQCVGVASTPEAMSIIIIDAPGAGTYTYSLFGFNGNYAITYEDKAITVMEIRA